MGINSIVNALGFGSLLLLISACTSTAPVRPVEIVSEPIERAPLVLPDIDVVHMKEVEWIIITEENFEEVIAKAKEDGVPLAFFSLTDDGYGQASINFQQARQIIQQQQAIIAAYEAYYVEYDNEEKEEENAE